MGLLSRPQYKTKYGTLSALFLKYDAAIFEQRGANLAVEVGMGSNGNDKTKLEENICIHIFTVSSAMVGVCLTVIGLIRVVITLGKADTLADDLLASDALLFLTSCLLSYAALFSANASN